MQKYKKNTTLPNKSHSPVRHSAAFAAVGFCGEAEAERRVVAFARRSGASAAVRFGGEAEAERRGSARRGSVAQRSALPLSAYLQAPVYQQNKNFYVFQHKKVAKIFGQFAKNA